MPDRFGQPRRFGQTRTRMIEHDVAHYVVGDDRLAQQHFQTHPIAGGVERPAIGAPDTDGLGARPALVRHRLRCRRETGSPPRVTARADRGIGARRCPSPRLPSRPPGDQARHRNSDRSRVPVGRPLSLPGSGRRTGAVSTLWRPSARAGCCAGTAPGRPARRRRTGVPVPVLVSVMSTTFVSVPSTLVSAQRHTRGHWSPHARQLGLWCADAIRRGVRPAGLVIVLSPRPVFGLGLPTARVGHGRHAFARDICRRRCPPFSTTVRASRRR